MKEQFEDQLTIASDLSYVRALDSNGNPIRISKEDLATVLTELIGTATSTKNGLQSSIDKMQSMRFYDMKNKPIYRITNFSANWQRASVFIAGGINASTVNITLAIYREDPYLKYQITGKHSNLSFYRKDGNLYLYCDQLASSPNFLAIASQYGVELVSNGVAPDDTYTKVEY